jgi:hypothetical protein
VRDEQDHHSDDGGPDHGVGLRYGEGDRHRLIQMHFPENRLMRVGLAIIAVSPAWVGIWATVAPRSFYDDFPGTSSWVAPLGPYDEHLVRDVGAFELGLLVVLLFAIVTLDRRVVQAALLAAIVSGLPHLIYHLTATGPLSTADNVLSLIGLALPVVLALALLPRTRSDRAQRGLK